MLKITSKFYHKWATVEWQTSCWMHKEQQEPEGCHTLNPPQGQRKRDGEGKMARDKTLHLHTSIWCELTGKPGSEAAFYHGREHIWNNHKRREGLKSLFQHLQTVGTQAIINSPVGFVSGGKCWIKEEQYSHTNPHRLLQPLASAITVKCGDGGIFSIVRTCFHPLTWEQNIKEVGLIFSCN